MMVTSNVNGTLAPDEELFLLEGVGTSNCRSFHGYKKFIPNGGSGLRRKPARNGTFRED
jgi:hypothetical protein